MGNLKPIRSEEWARFNGYLEALQLVFPRGELNLSLESAFYDIADAVTDEEVILSTFAASNAIESRQDVTLAHMRSLVNKTLSLTRSYWAPNYQPVAALIEEGFREGFWRHLKACLDPETATVVELGNNVPYVNMGEGFTLILYSPDRSRCMVLVANWSD